MNNKSKLPNKLFFYFAPLFIIGFFLPITFNGQGAYFTIHDNLDSEFVHHYLLAETNQTLNFDSRATIPNIMNGLPRSALQSGINFNRLLYVIFKPHVAYLFNYIVVHLVAFFGMFFLIKKHFLLEDHDRILVFCISLCFFTIPFYSQFGLSVAGLPVLLYSFLNVRSRIDKPSDYIIIASFPLFSSFVLVGPFIVVVLFFLSLIDLIRSRSLNIKFISSLVLLILSYGIVEYQLIYEVISETNFVSHRTVWDKYDDFLLSDWDENIRKSILLFFNGQYHAGVFPTALISILTLLSLSYMFLLKKVDLQIIFITLLIVAISLFYGFYNWFVFFLQEVIEPLRYFNGSRFYFLLPILWILLLTLNISQIKKIQKSKPFLVAIILIQIGMTLNVNNEFKNNLRIFISKDSNNLTYKEFFAANLFKEIDAYISKPKDSYRVVSLGIHPSIAQFNGFYTLDSYQTNYKLGYKKQFREIIAKELEKNAEIRDYFDKWGSRCYLFSAELGKGSSGYGKKWADDYHDVVIEKLDLNINALKKMGGEFILSSVRIKNYKKNGLVFETKFISKESAWDIYLYRVKDLSWKRRNQV